MADSAARLREFLEKIAEENNLSDYDINIKPISSDGANYTSQHYSATISNESKILNLFGKVIVFGEQMRSQGMENIVKIETFVYCELSKIYRQLEDRHNVPTEHRLDFPKFYGHNPNTGQELLVLEDLSAQGYNVYDRFKSVEWPYAFKAIKELAKLHALSFAFEQERPKEFEEAQKVLSISVFNSEQGIALLKTFLEKALSVANEENRLRLQEYVSNSKSDIIFNALEYVNPIRRSVFIHGDFRVSNLMHKVDDEGMYHIKVLDYQTMTTGTPVADLLYFIFTGTDEEFRAKHYLPLLDHYYSQLSLAMRRLGLRPNEIYSREDFDTELQRVLPYGLIIGLCLLPLIMVADVPVMDKDEDMTTFKINKMGELYPERVNGIINDYVKWKVL